MAQRQFRSDDTDRWIYGFGDGSDGALTISSNTTFSTANEGCSGSSGSASLTLATAGSFANGDLVMIHQSRGTNAGKWELNKISSGAGTTSITLAHNLTNTYADSGADQAQILTLPQYLSVTVDNGYTWSAPAWDGSKGGIIAFLSTGITTITGDISLNAKGYLGADAALSNASGGGQGEGTTADKGTISTSANGNGGGGGGYGGSTQRAGGGGGGNAAAGTNGSSKTVAGGTGGEEAGTASLVTAVFGGGGGQGARHDTSQGAGGKGGGLCLIITNDISIGGHIYSNGANGSDAAPGYAACGGGAGGSTLIKAKTATLGTNLITVSAGSGGTVPGGETSYSAAGGAGSVGRIHLDYSKSYSGSTTPSLDATLDYTITEFINYGNALFFNQSIAIG